MRGGTRLHWLAGGRVRRRLHERENAAAALRRTLETSDEELLTAVTGRLDRLGQAQRDVKRLRSQLAHESALRLLRTADATISAHFAGLDAGFLQLVARELAAAHSPPAFLTAEDESGAFFVLCAGPAAGFDVRAAAASVAGILVGRGGGSADMVQGKAGSLTRRDEAEAAFTALLGGSRR
jgi:alanyl-tRNA synthetase